MAVVWTLIETAQGLQVTISMPKSIIIYGCHSKLSAVDIAASGSHCGKVT
jgi:hypothetical protein